MLSVSLLHRVSFTTPQKHEEKAEAALREGQQVKRSQAQGKKTLRWQQDLRSKAEKRASALLDRLKVLYTNFIARILSTSNSIG